MSLPPRPRTILATALLGAAAILAAPGAALADCMASPPIEIALSGADIVFVGTVTEVGNGGRWASVIVEDIWKGPDLPGTIIVRGGPEGNAASSVDRSFDAGVRYLFFPVLAPQPAGEPLPVEIAALTDNSCTSTQPLTPEIAGLRPSDARSRVIAEGNDAPAFDLGFTVAIGGLVLLVFAVMLVIGLLVRGRSD